MKNTYNQFRDNDFWCPTPDECDDCTCGKYNTL